MAVTRIKNNQVTDASGANTQLGINANTKIQNFSITSGKLANNLTYGSDLTITGNLTVQGTSTAIDTTITTIEDPIIVLASTQTSGAPAVDIGFMGFRGNESNIAFVWDESADSFVTAFTSTAESNTTITITSLANLQVGNLSLTGNILGALNVTGNVTGGNLLTPGLISATSTITSAANITGGNLLTGGLISATSTITSAANITGGNLLTGGLISATSTITTTANITGGNLLYGSGIVSGTGNVYATNFFGDISGNIDAAGANTQVQFNDGDLLGASAGFTFDKTSNVLFANGNILSGGILSATGNIITDEKMILLSSQANAATANLSGIKVGNSAGNIAEWVYNSAQFHWQTGNQGIFTNSNVTCFNLRASGIVTATGNATVGNVLTGGVVSATANITGGNLLTGGLISATANVTGGNVLTGGLISATANITGGNLLTGGLISATSTITSAANITGGNILTGGVISATANITGGNLLTGGLISATSTITSAANVTGSNLVTTGGTFTGTLTTSGDALVAGNLVVQGNLTYINIDDLRVEDPVIILGTGPNGAPLTTNDGKDRGVFMEYFITAGNTLANAFMGYDNSTGNMFLATNVTMANDVVTVVTFGTLQAGNLNIQSAVSSGNITGGNLLTGGLISAAGNVTGGNVLTGGVVSATANVTGGNLLTGGLISATSTITSAANITGGNLLTAGLISATSTITSAANVIGGNITTAGQVTATANITGGNILTGGLISATSTITSAANITGGNILSGGLGSFTGNVTAANFIGNIQGNIDAGGANTNIQFNDADILAGSAGFTFDKTSNAVVANGNITGSNFNTAGLVTATGNVTGGNVLTGGLISATSTITSAANITGGNLLTAGLISATSTITSAANVIGGNITTAGQVTATANVTGGNIVTGGLITATGNITGANLILTTGTIDGPAAGRITINGSDIDTDFAVDGDTLANVFYVDAGTGTASFGSSTQVTDAIVNFATTTAFKTPVGNTAQRPATGVTGMLRFNTTSNALEIYDNTQWDSVGIPVFTVIADEQFAGDGSTVTFTLGSTQTTNSCIVSINGVVQVPTVAYSVSGIDPTCVLTFTEAPISGDLIDVREITTTTSVTQISNGNGNAAISVTDISNVVLVTGSLSVAGGIIGLSSDAITNGTSNVTVISSGGNIRSNVAGNTVQTISAGLVAITGDLTVSGNATLSGNILADRIENGSTNIEIITPGGNANISVGGVSNVALFTTGGLTLAGNLTLNGNIIDSGALTISTGSNGNLALAPNGTGNVNITGNVMPTANATANIGSAALSFNTVFAQATSAQYADLAEKYTADATYAPGTVVAFGGNQEVTISAVDSDRRVAGVISTNPSYRMNDGLVSEHTAMVALTGRVPTSVTGTVCKGDLMVSAGNGAARAEANPEIGTVIGKALADHAGPSGVIEVVVGRV